MVDVGSTKAVKTRWREEEEEDVEDVEDATTVGFVSVVAVAMEALPPGPFLPLPRCRRCPSEGDRRSGGIPVDNGVVVLSLRVATAPKTTRATVPVLRIQASSSAPAERAAAAVPTTSSLRQEHLRKGGVVREERSRDERLGPPPGKCRWILHREDDDDDDVDDEAEGSDGSEVEETAVEGAAVAAEDEATVGRWDDGTLVLLLLRGAGR